MKYLIPIKRKAVLLSILCVAFLAGCSTDRQIKVLESQGYSKIELSFPWFSCDGKDSVLNSSKFKAEKDGKPIDGAVCCGWLKKCTIRL